MKAKFIFICAALVVLSTACAAQVKIIEKSTKKVPAWVNGVEKNYLIVSVTAKDIEAAKEKVLNSIREQVVRAVAVNVQSSTSLNVQETVLDGKVRQFLETTGTTVLTKSGNIPYLNEIALSNVTDFYWEKQQDKKTKAITVVYHVKYPFPEVKMQRLVFEFKEADKKITEQLTTLCDGVETINNVEDIGKNIADLQQLYKLFDDARKDKAEACINNYRKVYGYLSLEENKHETGSLSYQIVLNGKAITTLQKPRVKSNCADNIKIVSRNDGADITYQTEGCYADVDNFIEITYNFGGRNLAQKFSFTVKE